MSAPYPNDVDRAYAGALQVFVLDFGRCPACGGDLLRHAVTGDDAGQPRAFCLPATPAYFHPGGDEAYGRRLMLLAKDFTSYHTGCQRPLSEHTFSPGHPSEAPHLWCPEEN